MKNLLERKLADIVGDKIQQHPKSQNNRYHIKGALRMLALENGRPSLQNSSINDKLQMINQDFKPLENIYTPKYKQSDSNFSHTIDSKKSNLELPSIQIAYKNTPIGQSFQQINSCNRSEKVSMHLKNTSQHKSDIFNLNRNGTSIFSSYDCETKLDTGSNRYITEGSAYINDNTRKLSLDMNASQNFQGPSVPVDQNSSNLNGDCTNGQSQTQKFKSEQNYFNEISKIDETILQIPNSYHSKFNLFRNDIQGKKVALSGQDILKTYENRNKNCMGNNKQRLDNGASLPLVSHPLNVEEIQNKYFVGEATKFIPILINNDIEQNPPIKLDGMSYRQISNHSKLPIRHSNSQKIYKCKIDQKPKDKRIEDFNELTVLFYYFF